MKKMLSILVIFLCSILLVGCETRNYTPDPVDCVLNPTHKDCDVTPNCVDPEELIDGECIVPDPDELIVVPDISGVSQSSAETLLLDRSLIPVIEYMYSKDVSNGIAIFTYPEAFKEVDAETRVTVYVSKGEWPYLISSESANIHWYSVPGSSGDVYEFYSPEVIEGTIVIEITVTYNSSYLMEWEDKFDDGWGWGSVSTSPDFDNSAYLWIEYETKTILSGVAQTIFISVDADELGVNKPTELYTNFYVHIDGDDYNVEVNFEIIW